MKIIKGLAIFSVVGLLLGACFSPPEYSNVPKILFEDLYLKVSPDKGPSDSLVLVITFTDGDGDLGLGTDETDDPYHADNFFLENGDGTKQAIGTETLELTKPTGENDILTPLLEVPASSTQKLVSVRTRKEPGYQDLPVYTYTTNCGSYYYQYDSVFILDNKSVFDDTYNLVKTIEVTDNSTHEKHTIYALLDTLYYEPNPNHDNITVDFFVKNPSSVDPKPDQDGFIPYDLKKLHCTSLNGRFPILFEKKGPLEGKLRYSMTSSLGFLKEFGDQTIRLKITIKDRALHVSNTITTSEKTLEQLRRN